MGIKNEIGVEIYETANFPTPIVKDAFNGSKIIDFVVGEDIIAVLLDNNEVYWCGCKAEYSPVK
jgi:alpha-tubulin suppressor-like RCC1 family protein